MTEEEFSSLSDEDEAVIIQYYIIIQRSSKMHFLRKASILPHPPRIMQKLSRNPVFNLANQNRIDINFEKYNTIQYNLKFETKDT